MPFNMEKMAQGQFTKLCIKFIERNNITKGRSVPIVFRGRILEQIFLTGNQRKIAVQTKHFFCRRLLWNDQVLVL